LEASLRRNPWIKGSIDYWFEAMSEQIPSAPLLMSDNQFMFSKRTGKT
jgi:hypothetical protein